MRSAKLWAALALTLLLLASAGTAQAQDLDYDVANGHFFTQTNGQPLGASPTGYAVTNDDGIPFWDAFQALGGPDILGYPVSRRFIYDGFVTQAMQKMVFQWRPDQNQVVFLNTFDALHDKGKDDFLLRERLTPPPFDTSPDTGLSFEEVVSRHLAFLDQNEAIRERYFADPQPIDHFGLPVSFQDFPDLFVVRAQRATFQFWKVDVPFARAGEVTVANGGDLAKEAGLWPADALPPEPPIAPLDTAPGPLRAASPEYGMNIFVFNYPSTTQRDLAKLVDAGFGWQKSLFQWRQIEGAGKGQFDWAEADRVVAATNRAGVRLIARLDFQPAWARADGAPNGPPDNLQDFADFVFALVDRYKLGSPRGRIQAVELWNEPNLAREWGGQRPDPGQYVQLLRAGYEAAKRADPNITVISAGLTPTGTFSDEAMPDDLFLQQMYAAGAGGFFDVLGAHGAGYNASPETSPEEAASNPVLGGNRVFTFRRVEDLRNVMASNGDGDRQIWILEFGWTSDPIHPAYSWFRQTEETKADYLVRAFQWARGNWAPWIGVMTVWNLPAPDWTEEREEYWWSIANPDGTDRPAYIRLREARASGALP